MLGRPSLLSGRTLSAMQGRGILGRAALALAAFGIVVGGGVVVATDGVKLPGAGHTVTLTQVAGVDCAAAGAYRAPDPGSIGLPAGLSLCSSGPLTVTEPGTVLDGWDVRGGIVVDAPDVVVRRSRVTGDGTVPYGITTTPAGSVRVEDTTLTGDFPEAAVGDDRWTGERIEVVGATHDGVRLRDGARLRNSRLHDFAVTGADGVVVRAVGRDTLVEDNRIELGILTGSAVLVGSGGSGAESRVVIRGNVLSGGGYILREDTGGRTDVRITGNRFGRDAQLGPLRVSSRAALADNTYLDGGPLPER